jgi:hypothetical protein
MALNARFIEGMQHLFVGARVDEVRLGGPLWSPAVGYQQGSLGASEAPERGAGCPRSIFSSLTAEGGTRELRT